MTRAARSVFVFGIYLVVNGLILFAIPNVLLELLRLPVTSEPWIRVMGLPMGVMGAFQIAAARDNLVSFFRYTLWGRTVPFAGIAVLVLLGLAPPLLLAFGVVDAAGALWTRAALRG